MPDLATVPLLLVEDNEEDALILQRAFHKPGFSNSIFRVNSATRAIEYFRGTGRYANRDEFPLPYMVLLNSSMAEVYRFIRETPSLSHLFVIALVHGDRDEVETRAAELGADSYLIRPGEDGNVEELVQLLRRHWLILDRIIEFRRETANAALLTP